MVDPIIWSNVEISVGISCACLPTLRPLVQAVGRILSGKSSSATWHASQFSQTADEIYGFEQSPKARSPSMTRRAEGYFVMSEKDLPTLPAAADLRRDSLMAGCTSPEKERRGSGLRKNSEVGETVGIEEDEGDDAV